MPGRLREIAEEAQRNKTHKDVPYDYNVGAPSSVAGGTYSDPGNAARGGTGSPAHDTPNPIGGLRGE